MTRRTKVADSIRRFALERGVAIERLAEADRSFRTSLVDPTAPLPAGAEHDLRIDHPRLLEIRQRNAKTEPAVQTHSRWRPDAINPWLDLRYFRGDNAYVWHYRHGGLALSRLRFLLYTTEVASRDRLGLMGQCVEDGAFGCWTYDFPGHGTVSRALLDAVNELLFLDEHLGAGARPFRALDIGAGYGRLANRAIETGLAARYTCTDAIAESSFLCEYYLRHRGIDDRASVCLLDELDDLRPGDFDLAVNIHSWSECTRSAVEWWVEQVARLRVPDLFVVPNEAEGFLTLETDGSRTDYSDLLTAAGYELVVDRPAIPDQAIREELDLHDRHCLFRATGTRR